MERQRTSDDIRTVGDLLTLFKGGERAQFYCEGGMEGEHAVPPGMGGRLKKGTCGKNLSTFGITKIPNNGADYYVTCPRCGRTVYLNAGWLAAAVMQAQAKKAAGMAPVVGTFPDVEEVPLPNGRKLIIARPGSAGARARGT